MEREKATRNGNDYRRIFVCNFIIKQHDISLDKQEKAIWIMIAGYSALIISGSTSNF